MASPFPVERPLSLVLGCRAPRAAATLAGTYSRACPIYTRQGAGSREHLPEGNQGSRRTSAGRSSGGGCGAMSARGSGEGPQGSGGGLGSGSGHPGRLRATHDPPLACAPRGRLKRALLPARALCCSVRRACGLRHASFRMALVGSIADPLDETRFVLCLFCVCD